MANIQHKIIFLEELTEGEHIFRCVLLAEDVYSPEVNE